MTAVLTAKRLAGNILCMGLSQVIQGGAAVSGNLVSRCFFAETGWNAVIVIGVLALIACCFFFWSRRKGYRGSWFPWGGPGSYGTGGFTGGGFYGGSSDGGGDWGIGGGDGGDGE